MDHEPAFSPNLPARVSKLMFRFPLRHPYRFSFSYQYQSGTRSREGWYITLSDTVMTEYFCKLERKANKPDALTKRVEVIEQRTLAMEKLMIQKFQQITDALETKKKKKAWYKRLNIRGKKEVQSPEEDDKAVEFRTSVEA